MVGLSSGRPGDASKFNKLSIEFTADSVPCLDCLESGAIRQAATANFSMLAPTISALTIRLA